MKRIFAFTLAIVMMLSVFALAGCKKDTTNLYADLEEFDSYVSEDSAILGEWKETSTADEQVWAFYKSTTLHLTETVDGVSFTTVCTFNFNDETNVLSFYVLTKREAYTYNVVIDGTSMTWTSADGAETRTFEKTS